MKNDEEFKRDDLVWVKDEAKAGLQNAYVVLDVRIGELYKDPLIEGDKRIFVCCENILKQQAKWVDARKLLKLNPAEIRLYRDVAQNLISSLNFFVKEK